MLRAHLGERGLGGGIGPGPQLLDCGAHVSDIPLQGGELGPGFLQGGAQFLLDHPGCFA
ncbi:hypothetical protein [Streptomyces rapamycinicus]|uniref:Uncharacterized protein n=1 Tax=Streptomyces rapamycinicus TaxID=1226757 RepID=A0ABR6M0D0_9ACTN|nr:hypothetical protein [Streptomyces rapamycinicus]AGP61491.1 hypothetical protein M271_50680 [Streptomyces rapamycinicus NRRL 5491]MBB4787308.1 hypothetical protein [Streptomyces rapamycinicus]UTP36945.1 hypothetical protein LIV37_51765 [Streptomyces rapamycinicus NRRL 5491]